MRIARRRVPELAERQEGVIARRPLEGWLTGGEISRRLDRSRIHRAQRRAGSTAPRSALRDHLPSLAHTRSELGVAFLGLRERSALPRRLLAAAQPSASL